MPEGCDSVRRPVTDVLATDRYAAEMEPPLVWPVTADQIRERRAHQQQWWLGRLAEPHPHCRGVVGPPELTVNGEVVLHVFTQTDDEHRAHAAHVKLTQDDIRRLIWLLVARLPEGPEVLLKRPDDDPDGDLSYDDKIAALQRSHAYVMKDAADPEFRAWLATAIADADAAPPSPPMTDQELANMWNDALAHR